MNEMIRSFVMVVQDEEGAVFDALLTFDGFNLVNVNRVAFDSEEPMRVCESHAVEGIELLQFDEFDTEEEHGEFIGQFLSLGELVEEMEEELA